MSGAMNDSHRRGDDGRRDEDRRRIDGTLEQRLPSGTFSRVGALPGPPRHHVAVLLGPSSASTRAAAGLLTAPRLPAHSMPWRRRWLRHAFAALHSAVGTTLQPSLLPPRSEPSRPCRSSPRRPQRLPLQSCIPTQPPSSPSCHQEPLCSLRAIRESCPRRCLLVM
jgi:hypothetical protein